MYIHNTDDTSSQEGDTVAGETKRLEDGRRVVQNGVDTGPLLEEHGQGADGGTVQESYIGSFIRGECSGHVEQETYCGW